MNFRNLIFSTAFLFISACTTAGLGSQPQPVIYRGDGTRAIPKALSINELNIFRFVDKWRITHRWLNGPVDIRPCQEGGNAFLYVKGFEGHNKENREPIIERDGRLYAVGSYKGEFNIYRRNHLFYGTFNNQGRENDFEGYTAICEHYFRDTLDGVGLEIVLPDPAKGTDEWIKGAEPVMVNGLKWLRKTAPIRDWTGNKKTDSGLAESWVLMIPKTPYWLRWTLYSGTGETSPFKNGAFHRPEKHQQIVDLFHQLVESVTLDPIAPIDIPASVKEPK